MIKYLGGDIAGSYGRSIYSLVFFGGGNKRFCVHLLSHYESAKITEVHSCIWSYVSSGNPNSSFSHLGKC